MMLVCSVFCAFSPSTCRAIGDVDFIWSFFGLEPAVCKPGPTPFDGTWRGIMFLLCPCVSEIHSQVFFVFSMWDCSSISYDFMCVQHGGFLKWGLPLVIIHFHRIFHCKPSMLGIPRWGKAPIDGFIQHPPVLRRHVPGLQDWIRRRYPELSSSESRGSRANPSSAGWQGAVHFLLMILYFFGVLRWRCS